MVSPKAECLSVFYFYFISMNYSSLLKFTLYADDTTLSFETDDLPNSNSIINIELNKVSQWLYSDHLTLNFLKSHYMIFHRPRANPPDSYPLSMGGSLIGRVIGVKSLGVCLDPCLRFH